MMSHLSAVDRRTVHTAIALSCIVALALGIRLTMLVMHWQTPAMPIINASYVDLALNIAGGNGYLLTMSQEGYEHANSFNRRLLPIETVREFQRSDNGNVPGAYFLPGYAYFIAGLWKLTGIYSYTTPLLLQVLLDALFVPVLLFTVLSIGAGLYRVGLIAAALYALALPAARFTVVFLPDSLSAFFAMLIVAPLAIGLLRRRPVIGAGLSGAALGLAGYFRSDATVLVPLLLLVIVLVTGFPSLTRLKACAAMAMAWIVISLPLSVFFHHHYGTWSLARPGVGLMLWQGVGQFQNPWGIEPLDAAAEQYLSDHGLIYGTFEGDSFLLKSYLSYMREDPGWFVLPAVQKAYKVAVLSSKPVWGIGRDRAPKRPRYLDVGLTATAFFMSAVGFVRFSRHKGWPFFTLAAVFLALWLSRVVPFIFMRDEPRFLLPVFLVYAVGVAFFVENQVQLLRSRQWASASITTFGTVLAVSLLVVVPHLLELGPVF